MLDHQANYSNPVKANRSNAKEIVRRLSGRDLRESFATKAVTECLEFVLQIIQPGTCAGDVRQAWWDVLNRYGIINESRIGYSMGISYPYPPS